MKLASIRDGSEHGEIDARLLGRGEVTSGSDFGDVCGEGGIVRIGHEYS